ncbi:MAG: hypothetical protein ACOZNI_19330 [Myxococcota bacterium]
MTSPAPSTTSILPASPAISRGLATVLAAGLVGVAALVPSDAPDAVTWRAAVPAILAAVALTALAPARWLYAAQLVGLGLVWATVRYLAWDADGLVLLAAPLAVVALARVLPFDRPVVRNTTIVAATIGTVSLWPLDVPHAPRVLGSLLQLVILAGAARAHTLADLTRYVFTAQVAATNPVPLDDVRRVDRSADTVLRGGALAAVGLLLVVASEAAGPWGPWRRLERLDLASAVVHSAAYWADALAGVAGVLLLDAGTLRMLGIPVRAPIDEPWKARDFLDYWKRANTWRYKMLSDVYFRPWFPSRGWGMAVGIFVVFVISGMHHTALAVFPTFVLLRWVLDGAVSAATAAWRQHRARSGVAAWIEGRPRSRVPAWVPAVGMPFLVIVAHGFLMQLSRPDEPARRMVQAWLPWL